MGWKEEERARKIPLDITSKLNPGRREIEEFARILDRYRNLSGFTAYTANYLTALIESGPDSEFILNLNLILDCLGRAIERNPMGFNP